MKTPAAFLLLCLAFFVDLPRPSRRKEASPAPTVSAAEPSIAPGGILPTGTRAWLDTVPPDKREKSDAYFEGSYWHILEFFGFGRDRAFPACLRHLRADPRFCRTDNPV